MLMPGRKYSIANTNYRYGFNGKENDNEMKGEGNQQDYGMRIYDPRLGRFLSVDPISNEYPMLTPFQFASNRPIDGIDRDGLEWEEYARPVNKVRDYEDKLYKTDPKHAKEIIDDHKTNAFITVGSMLTAGSGTGIKIIGYAWASYQTQRVIGIMNKPGVTPEQRKENLEELKGAGVDIFIGWGSIKIIGGVVSAFRSGIPQGLNLEEFRVASQRIYNQVKDISEDIVVQGSRAAGTARASSDIDFAIRVNSKEFDQLIVKSFGSPKEGTAKWKTMQNAIKTGKIQSGEAGLRSLRKNLENLLGKDVDISVVKKGGEFDNGIIIPVKK